jgi:hypothetical protein
VYLDEYLAQMLPDSSKQKKADASVATSFDAWLHGQLWLDINGFNLL